MKLGIAIDNINEGTSINVVNVDKKGKKGKKDESLFKILGKDLMNEIKNLEKFSKKKKHSRRK